MVEQALSVVNMKAIKMFFMGQAFFCDFNFEKLSQSPAVASQTCTHYRMKVWARFELENWVMSCAAYQRHSRWAPTVTPKRAGSETTPGKQSL